MTGCKECIDVAGVGYIAVMQGIMLMKETLVVRRCR